LPYLASIGDSSSHNAMWAGTFGKFEPNRATDVPIWLAIELRKRNQCDIKLPPWMTLKELREVVAKEKTDMSSFQPLPFHYIEVCAR
jgi:GINS complex subunit 2